MIAVTRVVTVHIKGSSERVGPQRQRWRCRRPGLWFCYWLGGHYATARRGRDGSWSVATFFSTIPFVRDGYPTLAALRRAMKPSPLPA